MARRKTKGNPKRVIKPKPDADDDDEQKKKNNNITVKLSGPIDSSVAMKEKAASKETVVNTWSQRRTRSGASAVEPSGTTVESYGALLKSNEPTGDVSGFLHKLLAEQNGDLGEFTSAILRFQREAQEKLNRQYNSHEGQIDDFVIQGGAPYSNGDNIHMPPHDMHAHKNIDVAVGTDIDLDADEDAYENAYDNAAVNAAADEDAYENAYDNTAIIAAAESEPCASEPKMLTDPEQPFTKDDHLENLENLDYFQKGSKRKGRGPTTLASLTRTTDSQLKKVIEYNENGQPIGPVATELASLMGALARYLVPITYKSWKVVPNTLKEKLWISLEQKFVIDPRSRKMLLSGIGEKWRSFKSILTRLHVFPYKDKVDLLAHPPKKYGFIKQEHWDAFVKSRLSNTFQALHEVQSKRSSSYLYPQRLGRRGYANLAEDLKKSGEVTPDEIDRSLLWKKARQNKKGEYANDATKEKAKIIDELGKHLKEEPLVKDVTCDVLTMALGTPEKPGRVRGIGQFVTPTSFFQLPKQGKSRYSEKLQEQRKLIESELKEERVSRLKVESRLQATQNRVAQLEGQLAQLTNQGVPPTPNSGVVSSSTNGNVDDDYEKSMDDEMAPSDPKFGYEKDDDYEKSMDDEMSPSDPKFGHEKGSANISPFESFYTRASQILTGKLSSVPIEVDDAVFGTEIELFLDLDDIQYICQMEDLSANCFMVYMRHLYDILASKKLQDMYAFVNPTFVSSESGENLSNAIIERLQTTESQWICVPFNPEGHWTLVVINMRTMGCYWMDPLGLPDQYNIKPLINVVLKALLQGDGKRRPNPVWKTVKCPKQPNNILSGFYILRYMRELIDEMPNPLTKREPFTKLSYSQEEIDAVRLEWIHSVEKYIPTM